MADVAHRGPAVRVERAARLLGIIVIFEPGLALEIDGARRSGRHFATIVIENMNRAAEGPSDAARPGEPFGRAYVRKANAFGARIIFVEDRPPPVDHRALHRRRAWRAGMDRAAVRRQILRRPRIPGQREQTREHRWHPLAVRHPLALDQTERCGGIEFLHADKFGAGAQQVHREAQRGRVVEWRGRQKNGVGIEAEQGRAALDAAAVAAQFFAGQRTAHALGPARRSRGVEHVAALDRGRRRMVARRRGERR